MASSSVYGSNTDLPFHENQNAILYLFMQHQKQRRDGSFLFSFVFSSYNNV